MNFVSPEDVHEVIRYLKENDITHVDTAGGYPSTSPGRSGELIGETEAASHGFTIDTKILTMGSDHSGELENAAIEKSVSTSLQRMGVEQVSCISID